jgi:hypothetical protein
MADEQGKKARKIPVPVALGVITVVFAAAAFVWAGSGSPKSAPEPASSARPSASSASSIKSTPPAPAVPQVLLDVSGSGTKQTQKFTTSGDWTLAYTYDCSSSLGGQGNFIVTIYNADGSPDYNDTTVNQLGTSGSDTEYYYDSGTHYLSIDSECSWHVTAKG